MTARVRKRIMLLVGAVVFLGASLAGAYAIKQAHTKTLMAQWLKDGMASYEAGNYTDAMESLGKYAGRDKKNEKVILALADSRRRTPLENSRHITEAIRFARLANDLDPSDPAPLDMLLSLYGEANFVSERLKTADALLALQKNNHNAMEAKVVCLAMLGKTKEARDAAVALTDAHPDDITGHRHAMELMTMLHEEPAKIRDYADQAADRFKDDQGFAVMRAEAHALTNDAAGAVKLAGEAASMKVRSAKDIGELLLLLDLLSRADPSLAANADALLEREMNGPLAREVAAVAAERSWKIGRPDVAREHAAKAMDVSNPSSAADDALGWWAFLGVASGKKLDDAEMKPAMDELHKRQGTGPSYWAHLCEGCAELNAGHLRESQQQFALAQAAGYKDDVAQYLLGDAQQRLGEWRATVSAWERLANAQPSWRVVHVSLVTLLLQHGQPDEAVQQAETALMIRPGLAEGVTLARAYAMLVETGHAKPDQLQRAVLLAEKVEQQAKNDALAQALAARIYLGSGKPDRGIAIIQKVIGFSPAPSPDVLSSLAFAVRPHDSALADQVLSIARASAETPDLSYQAACQLADTGKVDEGRKLLQRSVETHSGPDRLAYEMRLASYLDRVKDPGAAAEFARLASAHEDEPTVQLAALDSDAVWKDEALAGACIGRLRRLAGESSVAWKINEGRRLMVFNPTPARAAQAVQLLADALRQDPGNVGALVLTAEAHVLLGDRLKATELLAKAVDADPERAAFYPRLIDLLQQSGAVDESGRRLLVFAKIDKISPEVLRKRARLLAAQGMWDQAAEDFKKLAPLGDLEDLFAMGVVQSRRGDAAGANQTLEEVLKSPKLTEPIVVSIADYSAGQGDVERGRQILEQHLPADAAPHRAATLAAFYERFNRLQDAEQQYIEQSKDGKPESLAALAKYYYKRGKLDQAKAIVDGGLKAAPGNVALQQISGFIELSRGSNNKKALGDIAGSLDSLDAASPLKQLTKILQELEQDPNDSKGYVVKLEQLTKSSPTFFPAWRLLVEARFQRGEIQESIDAARLAARSAPVDPRPARLATEVLVAAGRYDEALLMAQQWRQRSISEPFDADLSIATINGAQKRYDDALKRIQPWRSRILAEGDGFPEHLQLLADLLAHGGQLQEAQDLLWPRAERDATWALRSMAIAETLPTSVQEQWVTKLRPVLDKSPVGQMAVGKVLYQIATNEPSPQNYERAVNVLKGALDDTNLRGRAALYLASCYERIGNKAEAIKYYRIALEVSPNDTGALNNLAFLLSEDPATAPEAAKFAQKAVDLATAQGAPSTLRKSFLDTLGVSLLKSDRFRDAEEAFRKGLAIDPNGIELSIGLAEATLAQGTPDQARTLVKQWDTGSQKPSDPDLAKRVAAIREKLQTIK
jgi:tetratricopeptide (TPR) repeat protein